MKTTNFTNVVDLFPKYVYPEINKLLVLGCGSLRNEMFLNAKYILGIDWSMDRLNIAKEKPNAITIKYNASSISDIIPDKSFDCVAMFDFLEHVEKKDALKLLKSLEDKVKKQIILYIPIEKKSENMQYRLAKQEDNKQKNLPLSYHLSFWTPEELEGLGFQGEYSQHKHTEKMGAVFCVKNII